jgi:hypothetical protein
MQYMESSKRTEKKCGGNLAFDLKSCTQLPRGVDYAELLTSLDPSARLRFIARYGRNLNVSIRDIGQY